LSPPPDPGRGYLSEDSKRRFTIVAGVLGAVFFLAQVVVPMLIVFLFMMPSMAGRDFKTLELDQGALWRGELWVVQRTMKLNPGKPAEANTTLALARVRLTDLSEAGPALPLEGFSPGSGPELLALGDRIWLIGPDAAAYYEGGSVVRLQGAQRPARATGPFVFEGRPAVISLGRRPTLATLDVQGGQAVWTIRDLRLDLPADGGVLRVLQAVEAGGSLSLFAQLCTESPNRCSVTYRRMDGEEWLPLIDDLRLFATWTAISLPTGPAVVVSNREEGRANRLAIISVTPSGPQRKEIEAETGQAWKRWRPYSSASSLVLLSEGLPGSLRLVEVANGQVTRSARKRGTFPFGPNMMLLTIVPQFLPVLLSLVLAFVLTAQMRRHRVPDYVVGSERRRFASLWQRALAQLVDIVPFLIGFVVPVGGMWRFFSDPEQFLESRANGSSFVILFFGLLIAGLLWALLVLLVFSYLEGRYGKTPGKWLLGIRVLGTDLRPCGFGRAFVRNLLTLADGFFSFMVGALLVALTENWQRLGDLAARTIVVVDEKPA
jgi:uncharacterized RDD family membrane protein YckC